MCGEVVAAPLSLQDTVYPILRVRRNHVRGSGCGPTVPARYSIPDFTKKVITFL